MVHQHKLQWLFALFAVLALATAAVVVAPPFTSAGNAGHQPRDEDCDDTTFGATIPQPKLGKLKKLPLAPDSARVDFATPSFSDPTNITNPLFPISGLHSAVLLGSVDGLPFRTETTLLPDTKTICFNGQEVETAVSQYAAFSDGRIHEVALDFYAQADDGSVWYFGEDVFNYEDGVVANTDGTWLAGEDGPAAMIMPASPQPGDVYRPENAPPIFEEVTVMAVGLTVDGPDGPVGGAILIQELHADGAFEEKYFAPGYGEFSTGNVGGDLEAIALAVPTDALPGPVPAQLATLEAGAGAIIDAAASSDWSSAAATLATMTAAWAAYQAAGPVPPMLEDQLDTALGNLEAALSAGDAAATGTTAVQVARSSLDLQLRHRAPAEIDLARFGLWARQTIIDAAAGDPAGVLGDATALEWARDRFAHTLGASDLEELNDLLAELREAADDEDLEAAAEAAAQLLDLLAGL